MMTYNKEIEVITKAIREACILFADKKPLEIEQKSTYDIVTEIDKQVEAYISDKIHIFFPNDNIHAEETKNDTPIIDRTWTIDPIDGTCNMARGIGIYGIQCSMFENDEIMLAVIYLIHTDEMFIGVKGNGCYLNGKKLEVNNLDSINNAIISFGDYPHKSSSRIADWQNSAIKRLYGDIAKIRMFGAACVDFSFVAAGRTDGTVVITKNLWDISPGILICKEAGAIVLGLNGEEYKRGCEGVIAACNEKIANLLVNSFKTDRKINKFIPDKEYEAVLFDFDGVILDTEKYHLAAWNSSLKKYGLVIEEEEYLMLRSTGSDNIVNTLSDAHGLMISKEEKENLKNEKRNKYLEITKNIKEDDLIPGIVEFLDYLKSHFIRLGVVSSSRELTVLLSKMNLLSFFDVVIDGNNKGKKKPDPEMYLLASQILGVNAQTSLVFEDSYVGIEAGISGGFDVIGVGKIRSKKTIANIEDFKEMSGLKP